LMACLRGYLSLHLHGQIFCLSGGAMKTSLWMLTFYPNKSLEF
jgi:hypothetical protein